MSNESRCKKHNEILKHKTVNCYECDGIGEVRWLLLFHKNCSLCHGTGKLEHFEPCKKCQAEERQTEEQKHHFRALLNRNSGDIGMECIACNGTGRQMKHKEVLRYGAFSKASGYGRYTVPTSVLCPYCGGTGKKTRIR